MLRNAGDLPHDKLFQANTQPDDIIDGDQPYVILTGDPTSNDPNFDALGASDLADVSVTNEDLDTAEVIVSSI